MVGQQPFVPYPDEVNTNVWDDDGGDPCSFLTTYMRRVKSIAEDHCNCQHDIIQIILIFVKINFLCKTLCFKKNLSFDLFNECHMINLKIYKMNAIMILKIYKLNAIMIIWKYIKWI